MEQGWAERELTGVEEESSQTEAPISFLSG